MKQIINFFNNLQYTFPTISVLDILDILLVAFLIYNVISLIRTTSAYRIAKAILFLLLAFFVTEIFNLHTLHYLLDRILALGFVALVIVFQPELRRFLERVGGRSLREWISKPNLQGDQMDDCIDQVVSACEIMSKEHVGALIVFERDNRLNEAMNSGTPVDAFVSAELLKNIFYDKSPLHDGAVIIRGDRVTAATCYLPLSDNKTLSKALGTRHRAGVGVSEATDSLTIIVSEETGGISMAYRGDLQRNVTEMTLRDRLIEAQNKSATGRRKNLRFRRAK
jgi:diadenylate cyclase